MGTTTRADIALIALKANTASLALTASYFSGSISNATSASYASTASYVDTASYALTASFFSGSISNAISASYAATSSVILVTQNPGEAGGFPIVYSRGTDAHVTLLSDSASLKYNPANETLTTTSSRAVSASRADLANFSNAISVAPDTSTNTFYPIPFASTAFGNAELYSDSSVINFNPSINRLFITSVSSSNITGSSFTGSFTGSLRGTSSWASNAFSANSADAVTVVPDSTNTNYALPFASTGTGNALLYSDIGNFYFNPSTNRFFATNVSASSITGSSFTGSFTGSLRGTSSWATNASTASSAPNASLCVFGNLAGTGFTNPVVTYLPFGTTAASATETQRQIATPMGGTLENLYIRTNGAAVATSFTTFTIRVNSVATNVKINISGGQAAGLYSNIINSASVVLGDEISLQVSTSVANGPQVNQYSFGIFNT